MALAELISVINSGGVLGMLGLAVFALWSGLVVPRSVHRAAQQETRRWQRIAWVALGLAGQAAPTPFDTNTESDE